MTTLVELKPLLVATLIVYTPALKAAVLISRASVVINGAGSRALAFGSEEGDSEVSLIHADVEINIDTDYNAYTFCDDPVFDGGRIIATVNGNYVDL
jgi:hypothetical protein